MHKEEILDKYIEMFERLLSEKDIDKQKAIGKEVAEYSGNINSLMESEFNGSKLQEIQEACLPMEHFKDDIGYCNLSEKNIKRFLKDMKAILKGTLEMYDFRKNESGEKLSDSELIELTKRVVKLLDIEIDELWFSCGWIVEDHEKEFKSLRNVDLRHVRESFNSAKEKVWGLLNESHIQEFKNNLSKIEKKI